MARKYLIGLAEARPRLWGGEQLRCQERNLHHLSPQDAGAWALA
jgi:hypothetical protein